MLAHTIQPSVREVTYRSLGSRRGAITRLVSPSDLGNLIKPFVFLDHFEFDEHAAPMSMEHGWHPHSGIATVTVILEGSARYAETTGNEGVLPPGSIEWMRAGSGVWHTGAPERGRVRGFQLWLALPPDTENAVSASRYVMPEDVPVAGPVRVILGSYGSAQSPLAATGVTYLVVSLKAGQRWSYRPPQGHTVAWVALHDGLLRTPSAIVSGEIAIFEPSEESVSFVAESDTTFVLGSAPKHPHALILGKYSVHTSVERLKRGEQEIRRIGAELRAAGKTSHALTEY